MHLPREIQGLSIARRIYREDVPIELIIAIDGWAMFENIKPYIDEIVRMESNPIEKLMKKLDI